MGKPRFDEAVQIAKQYREQQEAGWAEFCAADYRRASADTRPKVLVRLLRDSAKTKSDWDAVNLIAARLLRDCEPLPDELSFWVADVLDKKRERPKGRDPREYWARNIAIVDAVKRLANEGFRPTGSKGDSACHAVSKAFRVSYSTVQERWRKFRRWEEDITEAEWRWLGFDPPPPRS